MTALQAITPAHTDIDTIGRVAKMACATNYLGRMSVQEAAFIIMTGAEMGITPMRSLRGIHIVQGKPVLSADLMAAMAMASPECEYLTIKRLDETACVYVTQRRGAPEVVEMAFTMDDAKVAGLLKNPTWKKYPKAMLRARAVATICRAVYPDVLMGVYVEGEIPESEPQRARVVQMHDPGTPDVANLDRGVVEREVVEADIFDEQIEVKARKKAEGELTALICKDGEGWGLSKKDFMRWKGSVAQLMSAESWLHLDSKILEGMVRKIKAMTPEERDAEMRQKITQGAQS